MNVVLLNHLDLVRGVAMYVGILGSSSLLERVGLTKVLAACQYLVNLALHVSSD